MIICRRDHQCGVCQENQNQAHLVRQLETGTRLGLVLFTALKSNRMVNLCKEDGWLHLDEIEWPTERLQNGVMVKFKEAPRKVNFKVVTIDGDI